MRGLPAAAAFLSLLLLAPSAPARPDAPATTLAHRPTSTTNAAAQQAFDEGLTLLYAFNPEEARRRFEHAASLDPTYAMARWGLAMTWGVNINTPYDPDSQRHGRDEIARARKLMAKASPVERALIEATVPRFAHIGHGEAAASARDFIASTDKLAAAYPGDDDIQVLAAEAVMDAIPWTYWTADGKPADPRVPGMVARLQTVLARNPSHIQANHMLVHALEASSHPQDALAAADRLNDDTFEPAAEHLAHMPGHIYINTGAFHAAGLANTKALDLFDAYLAGDHASGHEGYRSHDCRFVVYAYMMSGESAAAKREAARCDGAAHVLASEVAMRFSHWDDLQHLVGGNPPSGSEFAIGIAAVRAKDFPAAQKALSTLESSKEGVAPIAAAALRAAIARARGDAEGEISALQRAVALQDAAGYQEPPEFFYPLRESLGGALYRAGRLTQAEDVFRADLRRNRNNPRSLFGLAEVLQREGRSDDSLRQRDAFDDAWRYADTLLDINDI